MRKIKQCSQCGKESYNNECSMTCRAKAITLRNQEDVLKARKHGQPVEKHYWRWFKPKELT